MLYTMHISSDLDRGLACFGSSINTIIYTQFRIQQRSLYANGSYINRGSLILLLKDILHAGK